MEERFALVGGIHLLQTCSAVYQTDSLNGWKTDGTFQCENQSSCVSADRI